ncbi:MAG TPA: aldehyde dehydrogenase family protein [Bacillota bacterium]|jgi:succinate-semialdehyde dehydrogenase|nr:aldehyde dehydrogenase family protein [Bacillota bacterium]HPZ59863.1 aldehyde dehydrogenase family protein [Bacillota bacterium]
MANTVQQYTPEEIAKSKEYIDGYIQRARKAQAEIENYTQSQVDRLVMAIAKAVYDNAEYLAKLAIKETQMGVLEDKIAKNKGKASIIWNSLKGKKSVGIIERDEEAGIVKVAKPIGVVAAITPMTNPIVTPMSNAMFAVKGRNAIVITPHHRAIRCSTETVNLINAELKKLGAPEHLVQILDQQSRINTRTLISSADVVVATGGAGMVNAAYSSGRPALGVGAGNVQCILDRDIDYGEAVSKLIAGRIFDNGIICSGEQSAIVPSDKYDEIIEHFKNNGAYVVTSPEERDAFRKVLFPDGVMNRHVVGQSVQTIAKLAGVEVPSDCKVIAIEAEGYGKDELLAKEKMCPVLAIFRYGDFKEAVEIAKANLEVEGKGHSVAIHSHNRDNIEYAGEQINVSRFVINQTCATSAGGSYFNGLAPTNTLGCGSWGHNSISENLTYKHLINISQIAYFKPDNPVPTQEELWSTLD